jgi:cytochrome c oxidase subunit II
MIGLGIVLSLIGIAIALLIPWFPESAAGSADKIDTVYDVLLICSVPVFVLVMTVAIYSVVRFRAKPGDMRDGAPIHGNTRLEVVWVTIPFLMVTALAIYGWVVLDDLEAKQPNTLVVNVTGQQFTWSFEYPSQKVKSSELVLPKDRPVEFRIHTKDVLHSFWVPEFRLKSDAVPGLTTKIRLTPNRIGHYQVVCAELCGIGHSTMRQNVRVVASSEFGSWLDDQKQAAGGGAAPTGGGGGGGGGAKPDGATVFADNGCASCHTLKPANATGTVGPDLDKIDNPTSAFIKQSIVDPNKVVTKGFQPNIMPQDFGQKLSPDELDALVEYLLKAQK